MWQEPTNELPDEEALVVVQVRGEVRENYYRIEGRWYDLADLDRWRMNTSHNWPKDRTWYVKTENVEAWHYQTLKEDRRKRKTKIRSRKR
jgi:hypothetical protein